MTTNQNDPRYKPRNKMRQLLILVVFRVFLCVRFAVVMVFLPIVDRGSCSWNVKIVRTLGS